MWIRSQNRMVLMDVHKLFVQHRYSNKDDRYVDSSLYAEDYGNTLGVYKSEERALQVLDEIHQLIIACNRCQNDRMFSPVFQMPEEREGE